MANINVPKPTVPPKIHPKITTTISIDNLDERIKMKDTMVINALPTEYFAKERIPNSVNLPVKELDKLTTKSVERRVLKFLKSSLKKYPKLEANILGVIRDEKFIILKKNDVLKLNDKAYVIINSSQMQLTLDAFGHNEKISKKFFSL